jgi:hypothetical protein
VVVVKVLVVVVLVIVVQLCLEAPCNATGSKPVDSL